MIMPRHELGVAPGQERKPEMEFQVWQSKDKVQVQIVKLDGSVFEGKIYCAKDERVFDVISNDRKFLPFLEGEEEFLVITKATISRVIPLEEGAPVQVTSRLHHINVEMTTVDGETRKGTIFAKERQRVVDVLNSDVAFVPFQSEKGELEILNKSTIDRVKPFETDETEEIPRGLIYS
jgi:translation initiation factor IF-1